MKSAQKAAGGLRIEKRYPITINGYPAKFERVLKAFEKGIFGEDGGNFADFEGGTENA